MGFKPTSAWLGNKDVNQLCYLDVEADSLKAVIPGFATRHAGVSNELDPRVDICIGYAQLLQMLH